MKTIGFIDYEKDEIRFDLYVENEDRQLFIYVNNECKGQSAVVFLNDFKIKELIKFLTENQEKK